MKKLGHRPYRSVLRADQARQTCTRILDAMAGVLADGDVEELTMPLVAERAGVSLRTVYRHFPTRAELYDAWALWLEEKLKALDLAYPDKLEALLRFPPALYRRYDENEQSLRAILFSKVGQRVRAKARPPRFRAIEEALEDVLAELPLSQKRKVLAVIYLLISAPAWHSMRLHWGLEGREAGEAAAWAIRALTEELRRNPESLGRAERSPEQEV